MVCISSLNYYLIESNGVKLGGYVRIKSKLLYDFINLLYSDNKTGYNYLYKRVSTLEQKYGAVIPMSCLYEKLGYTQRYLVTSETSNLIRKVYLQGQLNNTYYEFAFVLFLTGMVNSADYLAVFRDVNRTVGKFTIKTSRRRQSSDIIQPILLKQRTYINLMMLYVQNCINGVDYGVPMYDFVYHILKTAKLKSIKKKGSYYGVYVRLIDSISMSVCSRGMIVPSTDEIYKYDEEIAF